MRFISLIFICILFSSWQILFSLPNPPQDKGGELPEDMKYIYFTGDFRVVSTKSGKRYIINKDNKKILGNFDICTLYETENKEMVLALVGQGKNYRLQDYGRHGFQLLPDWRLEPDNYDFSIYNVTTRKLAARLGKKPSRGFNPTVLRFFGNYFTHEADVPGTLYTGIKGIYEIKENGTVEKSAMGVEEFTSKIVSENNLQYIPRDSRFITVESKRENIFWFFNYINFDGDDLLEQIPDNMHIYNWYLIGEYSHPLKDKLLIQVNVKDERNRDYTGLYNASENRFIIPLSDGRWSDLYSLYCNNDWIIYVHPTKSYVYHNRYYNIKTRKRYTYIDTRSTIDGNKDVTLYIGGEPYIVEDF